MTKATQTDVVLAAMLTENTGRHMLDSGGAYGRSWERNQGKDVETFLAAEPVRLTHDYVTLDVFHWLRDRLEYDAALDRKLQLWNALYGDDMSWLEVMETFAAKVSKGDANASLADGYLAGTCNSYNHEDSLSQTIQFTLYTDPDTDEPVVLLQIHGGCDVRGGYTRPRAFRVTTGEAGDMFDFDTYSLWHETQQGEALPGMPEAEPHALDHRSGEFINYGGSFESDPWNGADWISKDDAGQPFIRCPYCVDPTPMQLGTYGN